MFPNIRFYAPHGDESILGEYAHPYVPTIGIPASNFDAYRAVGIHSVENRPASWCFVDTDAMAALGRLIDGPIESKLDFAKAESILRAIFLNEHVEILVPSLKSKMKDGLTTYLRLDTKERNKASFEALNAFNCKDILFATEFVTVESGQIVHSSSEKSIVVGTPVESLSLKYRELLSNVSDIANAFTTGLGALSCFASDELNTAMTKGFYGFAESLYERVERPWGEIVQQVPHLELDIKLPPLISILLSRANSRSDIPKLLIELKSEFEIVRNNLNQLNKRLELTSSQAELLELTKRVNESFDAIVAESMLTERQRLIRKFTSVINFIKPVPQLYSIAVNPLSANIEDYRKLYQQASNAVAKNSRVVSRYIAAEKMAELLKIESIRNIITTHLTKSELALIRKS